jgi:hypothetical protein
MSDLEVRFLERAFDRDPSPQNAYRLVAAYRRMRGLGESHSDDFHDMNVLTYDIGNLDVDEEREEEITTWISRVRSFSHSDINIWEPIIYIGMLHTGEDEDGDPVNTDDIEQAFRVRIGYPDMIAGLPPLPTPPELIPIIVRALELGAWYISFNIG